MLRTLLVVSVLLLACWAHPHEQVGVCSGYKGLVQHDHLTVSLNGILNLTTGVDALCYNYTLEKVFQNRPGIAISVHNLQSEYSPDQFFSIKPVRSDSNGVIPFVIRTQWKYTSWTKISFGFFAEDKDNIEAGYYQVDSGSLAGCIAGKDIHVLLPFRSNFQKTIKAATFLHGFEITSNKVFGSNSPFQVQIINHEINVTGIAITISVTTVTQVQSLFISYIAVGSTFQDSYFGAYTYETYVASANLVHAPSVNLTENLVDFYGFNGFILNNNGADFKLTAAWNGVQFNFSTNSNYRYLNFNYFFLLGGACTACKGYPIFYEGNCISYCPAGSNFNGKTCITCITSQKWNGTECVDRCFNGKIWDVTSQTCICPTGQFWNGYACIVCPNGRTWNANTQSCECPVSSTWNGVTCVVCTGGRVYNNRTNECECPTGQTYNGYVCAVNCPTGQFYNQTLKTCACPSGQYWNGNICVFCYGGQTWNATLNTCVCPSGNIWNGYSCFDPCSGGRILDSVSGQCICPSGNWNGAACAICPDTQVWSSSRLACVCKEGNWNGLACITCSSNQVWYPATLSCGCPTGQNWNGVSCIVCPVGQNWNAATRSCGCSLGANWNGKQCISCFGGRQWNAASNSCTCPSGNWNGYSCISCAAGQTWNSTSLSCSCASGSYWNGIDCKTCTNNRTWSYQVNDCVCKVGNWNGTACITCPSNTNWNGKTCVKCDGDRVWNSLDLVCQCPEGTQWNGANCIKTCSNGKILENGLCVCPKGQFEQNGKCYNNPKCEQGYSWDGKQCKAISCNSGTSYNNSCGCCQAPVYACPAGAYWDGYRCVYVTNFCPAGMVWQNFCCKTSNSSTCTGNSYEFNGQCIPLSTQCPSGLSWNSTTGCLPTSNTCPSGSYYSGVKCIPYQSCTNGKVWNETLSQCVCALSAFFNGVECIKCSPGQLYANGGCFCPDGTFFDGAQCQAQTVDKCISIPNSNWNGTHCVCFSGFTNSGTSCFCQGIVMGDYCERCASKPYSLFKNGICQCNTGYVQLNGACVLKTQATVNCNVGTYFDNQLQKCLPCSDGCLSCKDCYDCTQCRPDYVLHAKSGLCIEVCGDGKRYTSQCDDGNNIDGDGCSKDCNTQVGFSCYGGSPSTKDTCSSVLPTEISIESRGQSRLYGKVILNVRLNYLPKTLLSSANDCKDNCNSVLTTSIIKGFAGTKSISARYIPTTSFIFSIEIDFGKEPIDQFSVQIGINQSLRNQYFSGVDVSKKLTIDVNPAYLAKINSKDTLS